MSAKVFRNFIFALFLISSLGLREAAANFDAATSALIESEVKKQIESIWPDYIQAFKAFEYHVQFDKPNKLEFWPTIQFEIGKSGLQVTLFAETHSVEGLAQLYLDYIVARLTIRDQASYVETFFNAKKNSLFSMARLYSVISSSFNTPVFGTLTLSEFYQYLSEEQQTEIQAALDKKILELASEASRLNDLSVKENRRKFSSLLSWRKQTKALDQVEGLNKKFESYVKENNRLMVRRYLELYLPWPVMEPYERQAWWLWLDALENPKKENLVTVYRGLQYNVDHRQYAKDGSFGLFSTVLAKNQGNYSRRLRSLTVQYEERLKRVSILMLPGNLQAQMYLHSRDPQASPFLSTTLSPQIAAKFSSWVPYVLPGNVPINAEKKAVGGLLAAAIDRRRLVPNMASAFTSGIKDGEAELLVPLVIFPDEMLSAKDIQPSSRFLPGAPPELNALMDDVYRLTGEKAKESIDDSEWVKLMKDGVYRMIEIMKTPNCEITDFNQFYEDRLNFILNSSKAPSQCEAIFK